MNIGGKFGLIKIAAGAAAGSGITCFLLTKVSSLRAEPEPADEYHAADPESQSLEASRWVDPKLSAKYSSAIKKSRELIKRFKNETGAPGVVVGVSVDGNVIWKEGFGYSNLENGSPCHVATAMRIASISKPITMALLAKMWEEGEIDIDKPIQEYVPGFPIKQVNGEEVNITTRQLACHTSGIRHYKKKDKSDVSDSTSTEFYIKDRFPNVEKSLELFKDDELLFKPGTSFEYTTYGYTLMSAVMEGVRKRPFKEMIEEFFKVFGMSDTYLDEVNRIIYNRSSYYTKNNKGRLVNAELVDSSYKWAGGGIISTVEDLLKFGNAMLYSYQQTENDKTGYLKQDTVQNMWTPVKHSTTSWGKDSGYGLGWMVVPFRSDIGGIDVQEFYVGHGGGAVGASSVLLVVPKERTEKQNGSAEYRCPIGVSVAILTNLQDVSCHRVARKIVDLFS